MSFFVILSIIGVLVGLFLISQGMWGDGIGKTLTFMVGIFVTVKELMDMVFAK
tara:strand:- start:17919 stop:18077 length:159 start_codon:yes stop_codon:yes gene_type:complete